MGDAKILPFAALRTDFGTWQGADTSFDAVVINRALHHLTDLEAMVAKVKRLLAPGGVFICQDYAYNRLDDGTDAWMYGMQRLLFLSGFADEDPATAEDEGRSIEAVRKALTLLRSALILNV